MNRTGRPALVAAALALTLCLLPGGAAFGQLTDTIKRAPNADTAAIQQYVDAAVKDLTNDDADRQGRGRENLSNGAATSGGEPPSPVFLDAYAAAVGKALAPLAQHEDMRVRLNAAIAAARVAERSGNTRLADLAITFMNDKNMAVALWGVKAARAMLPSALLQGGNNKLIPALVQSVQKFPVGPVVAEVYEALSLNLSPDRPRPPPATIKLIVPEMLRVYRMRADSYARGVPLDTANDNIAAEFFSFPPVWNQLTPQQRTEAVQAMSNLLSFTAQYAQLMEAQDRQNLITTFKRTGAALQVIGSSAQKQPVTDAARDVTQISTGMDGDEIVKRSTALTDALAKAFPGVKPAPKIEIAPAEADAGGAAPGGATEPGNTGKAPPAGGTPAGTPAGGRDPAKSAAPNADDAQMAADPAARAGKAAPDPSGADAPPGKANRPSPPPPAR